MQSNNKEISFFKIKTEVKREIENLENYSYGEETKLISLSLNCDTKELLMKNSFTKQEIKRINKIVKKRKSGKPLNKIFKSCFFYYDNFYINNFVLAPRKETEILVEYVLNYIYKNDNQDFDILDMCCGSGIIGLELAKHSTKKTQVVLADISNKALKVTRKNQKRLNLQKNTIIKKTDMFKGLKSKTLFDIIVSNPPYIKTSEIEKLSHGVKTYDPIIALDGKEDGLYFYKILASQSKIFLKSKGIVVCEIGFDQKKEVENLFKQNGFVVKCLKDYDNNDRVIIAKLK